MLCGIAAICIWLPECQVKWTRLEPDAEGLAQTAVSASALLEATAPATNEPWVASHPEKKSDTDTGSGNGTLH